MMSVASMQIARTARAGPAARVNTPRAAPNSVAPLPRSSASRASIVTRAEISGLSECGQFQELCKAEIPAKIPRSDFLRQMYRWMLISFQDNGLAAYGKRMEIDLVDGDDDMTNGMCVNIYGMKDGAESLICELFCEMDTEMVNTYDTLMPNKDGELEKSNRSGKEEFVKGRYFVIRRPVPFDESSNKALKAMIKDMTLAINKYYAFGSCFSDDAT